MSQQEIPVRHVRYVSATRVTAPLILGGGALALLLLGIGGMPDNPFAFVFNSLSAVFIVWVLSREPAVMETRPDGLYVGYTFGNSRLIPYGRIRRIAIGGSRLRVHTSSLIFAEAAIA